MPREKHFMPTCNVNKEDCFMYCNGKCKLFTETDELFKNRCPFYKTRKQAHEEAERSKELIKIWRGY